MTTRATPLDRTELCCTLSMEVQPGVLCRNRAWIQRPASTQSAHSIRARSLSVGCMQSAYPPMAARLSGARYLQMIKARLEISYSRPALTWYGRLVELFWVGLARARISATHLPATHSRQSSPVLV